MKIDQPGFRYFVINISILITLFFTNILYAKIGAPSNIGFGNVEVTDSLRIKVSIVNLGLTYLTITDISDPGLPFRLRGIPDLPVRITPEDSVILYTTFTPADIGTFKSTLAIISDSEYDPVFNIVLEGTGFTLNTADEGACYALSETENGSSLIKIDPSTGKGTLIGDIESDNIEKLAINSKGRIYGADDQGNLYRIDAVNAATVYITNPGLGPLHTIAFDNNDTLYTITGFSGSWRWMSQNLYKVDPLSGASSRVGEIAVSINSLAYDLVNSNLWGADRNSVYTIDDSSAVTNLVGNTNLDYGLTDLKFGVAGNLFAVAGGGPADDSYFIVLDKTTGTGSIIGKVGFQSVRGLAFHKQPINGKQLLVLPSMINFGFTEVSNSSHKSITLSNIGTEDLTVADITEPDLPFSILRPQNFPFVLSSTNSEDFILSFAPDNSGEFNDSFKIISNDNKNPEASVLLQGSGLIIHPADSGACYALTSENDSSSLLQIDPSTGEGNLIGVTGVRILEELAINFRGQIYGAGNDSKIYRIDAASGRAIFRFDPLLGHINGMAFDNLDSLYVLIESNLYVLDPAAGSSHLVGDTGGWFERLSFNPINGTLFALESNKLYTISRSNATTILVEEFDPELRLTDLSFDVAGNLFAVGRGNEEKFKLLAITETDKDVIIIGETGFQSVEGLGIYSVPLPGKHIRVIPTNVDFGYAEIGDSTSIFVNFSNVGTESLTISSISDPGPHFNLPDLPVILSSTAMKKMGFTFTPHDTGTFISDVSVRSDDGDNPALNIALNAQGIYITPAEPGACYALLQGTRDKNDSKLFKIDLQTGKAKRIGITGSFGYQWDLVIDSNSKIFGIEKWTGNVYRIDAATGKAWFNSYLPIFDTKYEKNDRLWSAAFDKNNVLYAVSYPMYQSGINFNIIDLKTSKVDFIKNYFDNYYSPDGITFDPTDNKMWSFSSAHDTPYNFLNSIDLAISSYIVKKEANVSNFPSNSIWDISFDLAGNLYAVVGRGAKHFIFIDKNTGMSTVIGQFGDFETDVTGLAFNNVPVPGKHIRISSPGINYGLVAVGDTSSRIVTISNIGTDDLTVDHISVPGSPFIIKNLPSLPSIISQGESKKIEIVFSVANAVKIIESISISSNDELKPELEIPLNAEGISMTEADSGFLYAATGDGQFIKIDPMTGKGTLIGNTVGLDGLAVNSAGKMYGSDRNGNIFRIDATTGKVISLLNPSFGAIEGIAFDRRNMLYASSSFDGLYMVDPVTGISKLTNLKWDGYPYFKGIAFDPMDGNLWISRFNSIFKVNTTNWQKTEIGVNSDEYFDRMDGLAFDAAGNLYTVINYNNNPKSNFAAINKTSGEISIIGEIGYAKVVGLAFHPKTVTTNINDQDNSIPRIYALKQNHPNPFNPSTTIEFSLPKSEFVELIIYNILGEKISIPISEKLNPGKHTYTFHGKNLASGIYYYQLVAGKFRKVKKMVLLR